MAASPEGRPHHPRGTAPCIRVESTEFPGYQTVLKVEDPRYTHVFRQPIFQHSATLLFRPIVLVEREATILGRPEHALPEKTTENGTRVNEDNAPPDREP